MLNLSTTEIKSVQTRGIVKTSGFTSGVFRGPQKGPEKWCRAKKLPKSVEKDLDAFLTMFDVFCPARRLSKNFLILFDDF